MEASTDEEAPLLVEGNSNQVTAFNKTGFYTKMSLIAVITSLIGLAFYALPNKIRSGAPSAGLYLSNSPRYGGRGGDYYHKECPAGSFVNKFYGGSGTLMDSVGIVCSDGTNLGKAGGNGGGYYEKYCEPGYVSVKVDSGDLVGSIIVKCFDSSESVLGTGGDSRGRWSGGSHYWACPNGQVITGIYGAGGGLLDSFGVMCSTGRAPTSKPTLVPSPAPSAYPTEKPSVNPTLVPTVAPTEKPSLNPTPEPTPVPSVEPTAKPSANPTPEPTPEPTERPSANLLLSLHVGLASSQVPNHPRFLLQNQPNGQHNCLRISHHPSPAMSLLFNLHRIQL